MKEVIGPATVTISQRGKSWVVNLKDVALDAEREAIFPDYESALPIFDQTCEGAARIHNVERPLPEMPNFAKTLNLSAKKGRREQ